MNSARSTPALYNPSLQISVQLQVTAATGKEVSFPFSSAARSSKGPECSVLFPSLFKARRERKETRLRLLHLSQPLPQLPAAVRSTALCSLQSRDPAAQPKPANANRCCCSCGLDDSYVVQPCGRLCVLRVIYQVSKSFICFIH